MSGNKGSGSERDPMKMEPPGFPYPGEEIIYSSARNAPNHVPGESSWFCVSKPDEEQVHTFGENTHRNPYRLTIHTPLRGSVSFFVNETDATCFIQAALSILADSDTYGGEQSGEHTFNLDYYRGLISDDYEVNAYHQDTEKAQ
jgi:hypothetical protein